MIVNPSGRRHMDRGLANLCRHHLMPGPNHPRLLRGDRDHLAGGRLQRLPDEDLLEVQRPAVPDPTDWGRNDSGGND